MPALTDNDFQLFGLEQHFALDTAQLQSAYLRLQAEVHPDKHAHGSDADKRVAMQWATRVNEAYSRLKSPTLRAAYLCELSGAPLNVESNTAMPAGFLMQQMEWREALDDANTLDAVDALTDEVNAFRQQLLNHIQDQLDIKQDATQAASLTRQLMFVDKFQQDLDRAAERLED